MSLENLIYRLTKPNSRYINKTIIMRFKLIPKKVIHKLIFLNGIYLYTEKHIEFHNPTPDYSQEELNQLGMCC